MATSFKRGTEAPPSDFRTPSPPVRFREAVSPDLSYSSRYSRRTPPAPEYEQITPERLNGFEEETNGVSGGFPLYKHYGSSRPHASRSPRQYNKIQSSHRNFTHARGGIKKHIQGYEAQNGLDDRAREEAELLLNFTREARFATPKTPITLQESQQNRSVSFNSYIQSRPSLSDLRPSDQFVSQTNHRPTTQNGTRSRWKPEAFTYAASPRRSSHGEQLADRSDMPPPKKNMGIVEAKAGDVSGGAITTIDSISAADSAVRSESVESRDEQGDSVSAKPDKMDIAPANAEQDPLADKIPQNQPEVQVPTNSGQQMKKDEDIPSICASCNFARNATGNEVDSELTSWISCDGCRSWFHFACAGFKSEREVRSVDKFRCKSCKPKFGPTTYVRKSARAHTSIDYAGLNEGVIKTSDADPEHHYVKDFKNGKKFTPETFARMRPELVTAEFFERGDGMKEPVVIPAALNPRPHTIPNIDVPDDIADLEDQVEKDPRLHESSVLDTWMAESFEYETVQDVGQDALDMVIPHDLTVRKVAQLYGQDEKLEVIDVKSQNGEDKPWTLKRWADYYESTGEKVVRNVISLEVSQSKLGRLIRRPKIVRDLDLQDSVWPSELQAKGEYPKVQFYCLMSVADCYTDFHIDFGGSSVYYHILRGKKTFFFIPPTEKHLKQYEEWCNSPAQNWTFLGDQTNQCYRVDLSEGDTMLIPAGWIHAVWTPADSLVIGGNFLTRLHYPLQIRVAQIEKATNVARKFRYPYFQKLLWYSAIRYLDEDPVPETVVESLVNGKTFPRPEPSADDYTAWGENSIDLDEHYHARYYPRAELDGLPELSRYLLRSALIATGYLTEGISTETKNAVKRSIPKGHNHGEPFEAIKKFALWCTWKRGNETIPYWAYPNYVPEDAAAEGTEKKLSTKARRKLDHEAASQAFKIAPDRQSTRPRSQPQNLLNDIMANQAADQAAKVANGSDVNVSLKRKIEDTSSSGTPSSVETKIKKPRASFSGRVGSGRKTACDACRKSRRACKHGQNSVQDSSVDTSLLADSSINASSTPTKSLAISHALGPYDNINVSPNGEHIKAELNSDQMLLDNTPDTIRGNGRFDAGGKTLQKPSGRTKACKDCRKSKRRCVHDELGNEDPKKLAEAAIPRPAAKRKKLTHSDSNGAPTEQINGLLHTTLSPYEPTPYGMTIETLAQGEEPQAPTDDQIRQQEPIVEQIDINSLIDPALLAESAQDSINMAIAQSAEQALSMITDAPMEESKYDPQLSDVQASQTINSSLVSPPDSTGDGRDQSPTVAVATKTFTPPPTTMSSSSRHSSRPVKVVTRFTPDSGTLRQPSLSSGGAASSRDSTSPAMSLPPNATPLKRSKSRAQSELEADEASLKLIREMQAQDMGLRRRN